MPDLMKDHPRVIALKERLSRMDEVDDPIEEDSDPDADKTSGELTVERQQHFKKQIKQVDRDKFRFPR